MRVALIHALRHSPPPIEAAFRAEWPDAVLMNLLDDSLSADLSRDGRLTPAMTERFRALGRYAAGDGGAGGILFSCSAFGPPIEAVARDLAPCPCLKPNEAGDRRAVAVGGASGCSRPFPGTARLHAAGVPRRGWRCALPGGGRAGRAGCGGRRDA
jgi:hypothetical protein